MALYKIYFKLSINKDLRLIPKLDQVKILKRINSLAGDPRPYGCEKLAGQNRYRIRQGDCRIIYTIKDNELVIWIITVGHRKDIYKVREQKTKYLTRRT
jgi:mRNA interferase RelE/StbE